MKWLVVVASLQVIVKQKHKKTNRKWFVYLYVVYYFIFLTTADRSPYLNTLYILIVTEFSWLHHILQGQSTKVTVQQQTFFEVSQWPSWPQHCPPVGFSLSEISRRPPPAPRDWWWGLLTQQPSSAPYHSIKSTKGGNDQLSCYRIIQTWTTMNYDELRWTTSVNPRACSFQ